MRTLYASVITKKNYYYRGFIPCLIVAFAASFLSNYYGGPVMLFALLLGMSVNFLSKDETASMGINFSASFILRFGVALLGARILVNDVIDLGWVSIVVLIGGLISTILFGFMLSSLLGLNRKLGFLSGGAVSICGISATMALSSVMPKSKEMENYTLITVIMIATFGSILMITYPILVRWLELTPEAAAFFIGGSIHDVSHVVGASFSLSPEVGKVAIVVKMFRVAMLIPMVWVFLILFKSERDRAECSSNKNKVKLPIPFFLIAFVIIVLVNNMNLIPVQVSEIMSMISHWCFIIAIVALGMKTNFEQLAGVGWRPIVLVLAESLFLGLLMLGWVYLSGAMLVVD